VNADRRARSPTALMLEPPLAWVGFAPLSLVVQEYSP
jgi:hypothetical protein